MEFNLAPGAFLTEKKYHPLQMDHEYDILILGGGPSGLTAAVYCMRKGVDAGIILKEMGGQVAWTSEIENYPGYRHINGIDLVDRFREQVVQFGIGYDEGGTISRIEDGPLKKVFMEDGRIFTAKSLILATGKSSRNLGVPGESEFTGRGVAYCSTCDAPFFHKKKVAVVGGANSAVEAALDLAPIADHVTFIHRRDSFSADHILVEKLSFYSNVDYLFNHTVMRLEGDSVLRQVVLHDHLSGEETFLAIDGIFIETGLIPNSGFAHDVVHITQSGEIAVDCLCRTDRPGIFASGDVTDVPYKQIVIAAGDGAKAALAACDYIQRLPD